VFCRSGKGPCEANMVYRRGAVAGAAVLAALASMVAVPQATAFNPGSAFLPKSGLQLRAARSAPAAAAAKLRLPKLRAGGARMAISDEPQLSTAVRPRPPSLWAASVPSSKTRH